MSKFGALIIIFSMYASILYGSFLFGIDLPTVLLAIFILVLITGILIDSKTGIIASILLSFHLFIFNYIEDICSKICMEDIYYMINVWVLLFH